MPPWLRAPTARTWSCTAPTAPSCGRDRCGTATTAVARRSSRTPSTPSTPISVKQLRARRPDRRPRDQRDVPLEEVLGHCEDGANLRLEVLEGERVVAGVERDLIP